MTLFTPIDPEGFVDPKPVAGWETQILSPPNVLLQVTYYRVVAGANTGLAQSIRISLAPAACLGQ